MLHRRVIYDQDGLVALDKPAGLACQQGPGLNNTIDDLLPELADALGHKKLTPVHRWAAPHCGLEQTGTNKSRDVSTGPLARPFARSLAPLSRSLAPDCPLRSRPPLRSLVRSLAHFAHSLARGKVNF